MAVQVSYPGVYIDEFAPGAPIEGVGTSTAAFIGPAARGELDHPTKITSWDQFRAAYGEQPLPGFFLWYAVRGFFENGGKVCYIVRASNGAFAHATLVDYSSGQHGVIRVRARQPGAPATAISVEVIDAHALASDNVTLFRPAAQYTITASREVEIQGSQASADAAQFRPGDVVNLGTGNQQIPVVRVAGARLRLAADLVGAVGDGGTVRLADLPAGSRTIRLQLGNPVADGLVSGTMLTITQGAQATTQVADTVETELISSQLTTYRVTFRQPLTIAIGLDPDNPSDPDTVQSEEFTIRVTEGTATDYPNLALDPAHPRYYVRQINNQPGLVTVEPVEPPPATAPPNNLPAADIYGLADGAEEDLAALVGQDYIDALETLRDIDDVNLIAAPDASRLDEAERVPVQQAVIAHCEQLGDRFAILDAAPGLALFGDQDSVEHQRRALDSTRGYGALYYPWLRARPAGRGAPILMPPSGHVCGVIARSDGYRGVHKAPANEIINGALDVERTMSDVDQGQLNMQGINVIRVFQSGGRPVLWGARTTATDRNWQYVNIRRLFLFLEESIQEGIRWAVFEPNIQELWEKLKRSIGAFLTQQWRDGALFGATPKEAFYVRIDETLNPASSRALGRLYIEIGVQPPYPAEFVIVRIGIWQGGAEVTEG